MKTIKSFIHKINEKAILTNAMYKYCKFKKINSFKSILYIIKFYITK